ncbi:MAG: hypothetical protein U0900_09910 [Myxococcota bacterium]
MGGDASFWPSAALEEHPVVRHDTERIAQLRRRGPIALSIRIREGEGEPEDPLGRTERPAQLFALTMIGLFEPFHRFDPPDPVFERIRATAPGRSGDVFVENRSRSGSGIGAARGARLPSGSDGPSGGLDPPVAGEESLGWNGRVEPIRSRDVAG